MDEGVDLGRRLHPGRAAPYDHEGESRVGELLGGQVTCSKRSMTRLRILKASASPPSDRLCSFTPGTPKKFGWLPSARIRWS